MAEKNIFTLIGYTHGTCKDNPTIYGAYTTWKKAEAEILRVAEEAMNGYKSRAKYEPEEYGDMADAFLQINNFYGRLNTIDDSKYKHIHLQINEVLLK